MLQHSDFIRVYVQEKTLPGVVMSSGGHVYKMLYQLADLDEPRSVADDS